MKFAEIPGMSDVSERLIKTVRDDRLSHAMLLSGQEGSWTLPIALALATYVNCENPGEKDSCGECPSCRQNSKWVHPDVNYVFPMTSQPGVKAENLYSSNFLKQWREFLSQAHGPYQLLDDWASVISGENKPFNISRAEGEQIIKNLALKPFMGKYKVMLIWLPEYFHNKTANAILKILEEPRPGTLFILASQDSDRLLNTILSRTRQIRLRKPNVEEVVAWLQKYEGASEGQARQSAMTSEGNIHTALEQLKEVDSGLSDIFREWLLACYKLNLKFLVEFAESFQKMNKVKQRGFMQYAQFVLRDCLRQKYLHGEGNNPASQGAYREFVVKLSALLTENRIESFSETFSKTQYRLERNANPKITMMDMSLKLNRQFKL